MISRRKTLTRALGRIGRDAVRYGALQALPGSDRERHREALGRAVGRHLSEAARSMRGSAMKLAQMLAWESGFLPAPALEELSKTWYQALPMTPALVANTVEIELGAAPAELFVCFELEAFAAASLGQAHAARDRRGRDLVVKVRYPDVDREIRRDLNDLRDFALYVLRSDLFLELLDEVEPRLLEECDYRREARQTRQFSAHFSAAVDLPVVVSSRSSGGVLTTTRVAGHHLPEWLARRPPRLARDAASQALCDFFWRSLSELGAVHSDPNPGNFLFQQDGRVGVIDFGSVKRLEPELVEALLAMIAAYREGDDDLGFERAFARGMFGELRRKEAREVERRSLRPFAHWLVRGMSGEPLDFGRHRDHALEGRALFLELARANPRQGLYADLLFVNRALCGLYFIFAALAARVDLTPPVLGGRSGAQGLKSASP